MARSRTGARPPGSTPVSRTAASSACRVPPSRRNSVLRDTPAARATSTSGTSATSLPSACAACSAAFTRSSVTGVPVFAEVTAR
ncbi:Uncharacterised protein [Mycobacteroides abscessus subsp. abscessus]|nr:Uncharacterised protein [Mycobacteroides abscessus subsp. abscessus]